MFRLSTAPIKKAFVCVKPRDRTENPLTTNRFQGDPKPKSW